MGQDEVEVSNKIIGEESTVFDLYLSDSFRGAILARYTDDWFEVDDPKDLLNQLPEIKQTPELLQMLSGKIERSRAVQGVGNVRYDLSNFRIILGLDAEYLPAKDLKLDNRIGDPEDKFSLAQNFRGSSSGDTNDQFNSALNHRTVAAYGKYLARLDGTYVQDQDYVLYDGSAGGIVGPFEVNGGYIQTPGQTFASTVDMLGVKLQTSDQLFINQDYIRGSRLQIFVPSRARVEFFRDGQLLSVQVLDFGLQEVDARAFPDGSYNIDIVINEDNGNVTRESRFYTKSGYLAVGSTPILSLAVGTGRDRLDILDVPVYQTGIRYRAFDALELNANAYGTDTVSVYQLGGLTVYRDIYLATSYSVSSHGKQGISGNLTGKLLGLTFSLGGSTTLNPDSRVDDAVPQSQERDEDFIRSRIDDISRERTTASVSIFKQWASKFQLGVSLSQNKRAIDPFFDSLNRLTQVPNEDRYAYGPRFEWRIVDSISTTLRLETFYLRSDQGDNLAARIGLRYRYDARWTVSSEGRGERVGSDHVDSMLTTAQFDNRTQQNRGTRATISNELRHDERSVSPNQVTDQGRVEYTNDYLRTDGFVRDVRATDINQTNLGLDAEAAFLMSNEGKVSVSRPIREGAAIIVDLESKSTETKFNLLINGQNFEVIQAGRRTVVGMQPYRTYKVSIRPTQQSDLVNYDQTIFDVTLFPGNIVRKTWRVEKIVIVLGRLVDAAGKPLPRFRIRGTKDYVVTEEDGSFQADLTGLEELTVDSRGVKCKVNAVLPENHENPYFVELGDVVCN